MTNPVIQREFLSTFRSSRSMIVILAPAFITALLVILKWPTDLVISETSRRSLEVLGLFGYGLGALVCLLSPVSPAISLVKERIQGTLNLLLHSPLSPAAIFFGKLFGAVALIAMSLFMALPAAGACYAMGGITLSTHLLPLFAVLLVAGIQLSAVSLTVSSYSKNIDSSVRMAYAMMLILVVGVLGPYQVWQGSESRIQVLIAEWLRNLSPLPALTEILGHDGLGGQGIVTESSSVTRYFIMAAISIVVSAILSMRRLHIRVFDESRDAGTMTDDRSAIQRVFRRLLFLVDPQRRSGNIGNWSNPILVKEFRSRKFGRASWMLRMVAVCAVASIALTYFAASGVKDWTVEMIGALLVILQMALILLLAPGLSASLLPGEIESGGWTMLRITPQSSFSIVIGKLFSVSWTMLLVLLATIPGYLVMIYVKPILQQQILMTVGNLLLATAFTVIVSAAIGSFFRRSTPATMTSYTVLTALTAVPILIWMGRDAPFGFATVETALIMNPMSSSLSLMETRGFENYRLIPANWYFLGTGCVVGLVVFWGQVARNSRPD